MISSMGGYAHIFEDRIDSGYYLKDRHGGFSLHWVEKAFACFCSRTCPFPEEPIRGGGLHEYVKKSVSRRPLLFSYIRGCDLTTKN